MEEVTLASAGSSGTIWVIDEKGMINGSLVLTSVWSAVTTHSEAQWFGSAVTVWKFLSSIMQKVSEALNRVFVGVHIQLISHCLSLTCRHAFSILTSSFYLPAHDYVLTCNSSGQKTIFPRVSIQHLSASTRCSAWGSTLVSRGGNSAISACWGKPRDVAGSFGKN